MIIDIHTHSFPEAISARVLDMLSHSSNAPYYLDGTNADLARSMQQFGVDYSVLVPIATNAEQYRTINKVAEATNAHWQETGILSFGSLHPDNENYKEILRDLVNRGFKGIKLHPVYQDTCIDDIRFLRIMDYASELGLIILVHGVYDIGFPGVDSASPTRIHNLLKQIVPDKLILAHMGGWGDWDTVEAYLLDYPIYLDMSFSLTPIGTVAEWPDGKSPWEGIPQYLSPERFCRMVRHLGADRVLFGSDSPWTSQGASIQALKKSGLNEDELALVFYQNAATLLGIG